MACFVLVHGAYHGGWCWRDVAMRLQQAGHTVFTPTLTGLGERRHLLAAATSMETFVLDIMNVFEFEGLHDVILVGHSFGGRVIGGVADRMPERIRRLVFLDAGLAPAGESRLDGLNTSARADRIAAAQRHDGGISVPPPSASALGITDPDQAAWLEARLTPQRLVGHQQELVEGEVVRGDSLDQGGQAIDAVGDLVDAGLSDPLPPIGDWTPTARRPPARRGKA